MREWIRQWLAIAQPSKSEATEIIAAAMESLAAAQKAHISDLRVLIDKGHEREAQLADMVKIAMEHQFYRPQISGKISGDNRVEPPIPSEALTDVVMFDEEADAALMKAQEDELRSLIQEQNAVGQHKVEA